MAERQQNVTLYRDRGKVLRFTVTGDFSDLNVDASDIRWRMARNARATPVIQKSLGTGIAIIGTDQFEVTILQAETETINIGTYYHEAMAIDTGGVGTQLATGIVEVEDTLIDAA